MSAFSQRTALKLFNDTYDMNPEGDRKASSLDAPWQGVSVVSSNCPVHIGTRLQHISDNTYQCPRGREIYKSHGSVANQSSKDRYDLHISIK